MTTQTAKYEQMIQDLRVQLRPQREWGEGRGLFLVIGHFLNGIAGGAWLMSLVFDNLAGPLSQVSNEILERQLGHFDQADPAYGAGVRAALKALASK